MIRAAIWAVVAAVVVLVTRTIVYAIAPTQSQLVAELEHRAGGPDLAGGLAAGVGIAALGAAAVLWLAVVAVRERVSLETRELVSAPKLEPLRLGIRAIALFLAAALAFALLESTIHWREGLGWHGVHCLIGPAHRDAVPILFALTLLAVALHGAVEHLLGWVRRAVSLLVPRVPFVRVAAPGFAPTSRPCAGRVVRAKAPRGPPVTSLG